MTFYLEILTYCIAFMWIVFCSFKLYRASKKLKRPQNSETQQDNPPSH